MDAVPRSPLTRRLPGTESTAPEDWIPDRWTWVRACLLCLTAALLTPGYVLAGAGLLFLAMLAETAALHGNPWVRTPLDGPLALWIGIITLSSLLSPNPTRALANTVLLGLGALVGCAPLARTLREWPGFVRPFYAAWVAGGVVAGCVVVVRFLFLPGGRGDLPELGFNAAGTVLLVCSLLASVLFVTGGRWRWGWAASQAPILAGLGATLSRGAWLGWGCGLLALLALSPVGTRRMQWRLWALALLLGLIGTMTIAVQPVLRARARTALGIDMNRDRIILWQTSLRIFLDHPWWGVGFGAFADVYPKYRRPDDPNGTPPFAHNLPLSLAAETGIFGLVGFIVLLGTALGVGIRNSLRGPPDARMLRAGTVAALLGIMAHQLVDGTLQAFHLGFAFWFLVTVAVVPVGPSRKG